MDLRQLDGWRGCHKRDEGWWGAGDFGLWNPRSRTLGRP